MGAEERGRRREQIPSRGHIFSVWGDGYFRVRVSLEELPLLEFGQEEGGEGNLTVRCPTDSQLCRLLVFSVFLSPVLCVLPEPFPSPFHLSRDP